MHALGSLRELLGGIKNKSCVCMPVVHHDNNIDEITFDSAHPFEMTYQVTLRTAVVIDSEVPCCRDSIYLLSQYVASTIPIFEYPIFPASALKAERLSVGVLCHHYLVDKIASAHQ
jgi:hypothetical protein